MEARHVGSAVLVEQTDQDGEWPTRVMFPIPPWMEATVTTFVGESDARWEVSDVEKPTVPCPYRPGQTFGNSVDMDMPVRTTDRDHAIDFISVFLTEQLHEMLEWIRLDGKPLAISHPESDMAHDAIPDRGLNYEGKDAADLYGYWRWTGDRMREVVEAYCERYPITEEHHDS